MLSCACCHKDESARDSGGSHCVQAVSCFVQVTVSVIEIYCERIRDLLEPGNDNLQVQQERLRGITVAHTTEVPVSSEAELVKVMHKGLANRAVASTAMNAGGCLAQYAVSSRHHSHRYFVLLVSMLYMLQTTNHCS